MSGSTDLAEALANHNKYLRRAAVLVFDLGIGHSVDNMADIVALRTLAASTSGVYSSLPDESNIYAKLAEYYSFSGFKRDIGEGVVVSPPYYDAFGLGIVIQTLPIPMTTHSRHYTSLYARFFLIVHQAALRFDGGAMAINRL